MCGRRNPISHYVSLLSKSNARSHRCRLWKEKSYYWTIQHVLPVARTHHGLVYRFHRWLRTHNDPFRRRRAWSASFWLDTRNVKRIKNVYHLRPQILLLLLLLLPYKHYTLSTFQKIVFDVCFIVVPDLFWLLPAVCFVFYTIIGYYLIIAIKRLVYKNRKLLISASGKLSFSERSTISITWRYEASLYRRILKLKGIRKMSYENHKRAFLAWEIEI